MLLSSRTLRVSDPRARRGNCHHRQSVHRFMDTVASDAWVGAAVGLAMEEWSHAAGPWQSTSPPYSVADQKLREKAYDRALRDVRRTARRPLPDAEDCLVSTFARFAAEALDLGPDAIKLLTHGFLPVGTQLARWAHRFDPQLADPDIAQACRNAWTACGMQPLFGCQMRLTPAILGYSLLYPYTDNHLDERAATHEEKLHFSRRFRSRLRGESPRAADSHECLIWELVRLIEDEFPRMTSPQVFDSLLAIHDAQVDSLSQLEHCGHSGERKLLRISCAKGGTSVLADACLVRGSLDEQESEFAFLWGVLLQLGDDLQDVHEDLARGSDTLFTRAVRARIPLDSLLMQLLNFSDTVAARMNALPHGSAMHKQLLRSSWRSLILMAMALADTCFTPAFLARMEPCSPFRFAFLRSRRDKLAGDRGLFHRLFEVLLNRADQDAPLFPVPKSGAPVHAEGTHVAPCTPILVADA